MILIFYVSFSVSINGVQTSRILNANVINGVFEAQNCFFASLTSSLNGGAICISEIGSVSVSIKESSFVRCNATNYGGTYYMNSAESITSFLKVCISESQANQGCTIYSKTSSSGSFYHLIDQMSIVKCCPVSTGAGGYSINTYFGDMRMSRTNFSDSIVSHCLMALFSHSNLVHSYNNYQSNQADIINGVVESIISSPIQRCNFVSNIRIGTTQYGIVHNNNCSPYLNVSDCVFVGNTIRIFDEYVGKVYAYFCFIDSISYSGSPVLYGCITNTVAPTYAIDFLSQYKCHIIITENPRRDSYRLPFLLLFICIITWY